MKSGLALPAGLAEMRPSVLLLGASGLIGRELLRELCKKDIVILMAARSATDLQSFVDTLQPKASVSVISFEQLWTSKLAVDMCFCALGTTQKVSGKAGLKSVDLDLVVRSCQWAANNGAQLLSVVSALGASVRSAFYYSRIKGQMELGLRKIGSNGLHIWRPSVLKGIRPHNQPARRAEQVSGWVLNSPCWGDYQALPACSVARAMLRAAEESPTTGEQVFTARDIRRLTQH